MSMSYHSDSCVSGVRATPPDLMDPYDTAVKYRQPPQHQKLASQVGERRTELSEPRKPVNRGSAWQKQRDHVNRTRNCLDRPGEACKEEKWQCDRRRYELDR